MEVTTVLGPIPPEALGFTSMHEHIMVDGQVWRRILEPLIPAHVRVQEGDRVCPENMGLLRRNIFLSSDNLRLDDEQVMAAEVEDFKAGGGAAMVEMSCDGLRLDLAAVRRISEETGVHIVATTGLYVEDSWPEGSREMSIEELTAWMVREAEEGIGNTGIRAGHIGELGMMNLGDRDVRLLKAGARASIETGLSVSVHQEPNRAYGQQIIDILTGEGTDPERIILSHVDAFIVENRLEVLVRNPDRWGPRLDYAEGLLDRGVVISFDCFGHLWDEELGGTVMVADWQRVAALLSLLQAGYGRQIVLGTDTFLKILLRRGGGEGYRRLTDYVVPTLTALGASDYDVQLMTVTNPARLLAH